MKNQKINPVRVAPFKAAVMFSFMFFSIFFPGLGGTGLSSESFPKKITTNPSILPTVLTLARSKVIARKNSPTLASVRERMLQAQETIAQARATYLPTLSLDGSWNYTQNTDAPSTSSNENLYTHGISATQVLFDGFERKYSLISAKWEELKSFEVQRAAESLLVWSVASAYLEVQLAREDIKIAASDMAYNQELAKEAHAREKAGTGSLSDLLNFETKVNSAESSLIHAQQAYREAVYILAALMGYKNSRLPSGMELASLETNTVQARVPGDTNKEMETFLKNRPDLKQSQYAIQIAQAGIQEEKSDFFPTVSLIGSYGTSSVYESHYLNDTDYMGASLGINVSFELFSGGSTRSKVRQAQSKKRELEKNLEEAKISAQSEIRSAADNIASAKDQLGLQEKNTGLMKKTRDLVKKEYKAGQQSLVRLNQAQNDLVATQGNLASARVALILALEAYDYYTGKNIESTP